MRSRTAVQPWTVQRPAVAEETRRPHSQGVRAIGRGPGTALLIAFSAAFVFGSQDYYNYAHELTITLHQWIYVGLAYGKFFSLFDILLIVLSFSLMSVNPPTFRRATPARAFLVFGWFACYAFLMVNPNNSTPNPIAGMPLLSNMSNYALMVFLVAVFLARDPFATARFLGQFARIWFWAVLIRTVVLAALWAFGYGNANFFGFVDAIVTEDDTLFMFACAQTICVGIYWLTRRWRFLGVAVCLFAVQVLSFRRSGFFVAALGSVTVSALWLLWSATLRQRLAILVAICAAVPAMSWIQPWATNSPTANLYIGRYFGIFSESKELPDYETDAGHLEHSSLVTSQAIGTLGFWGLGYGDKEDQQEPLKYEWWARGVHNAYVGVWQYHGLFALVYYAGIILIVTAELLKTVARARSYSRGVFVVRAALLSYFVWFLVSIWFLSYHHLVDVRNVVMRSLILLWLMLGPAADHALAAAGIGLRRVEARAVPMRTITR